MFIKKLEFVFAAIMLFSIVVLAKNGYESYIFDSNPISDEIVKQIESKEQEILTNMQENYGFKLKIPLVITDKISSKHYGVAHHDSEGRITIYLNKQIIKESIDYVLDTVIAHEYAHALVFKQNAHNHDGDGHSELWQQTCKKLGGKNCQNYVNHEEIVMGKMPFSG